MLGVAALVFGGCVADRGAHADAIAAKAGLQKRLIQTDSFLLTTYSRTTDSAGLFDVYIEGDGQAWLSPTEPARNPTPRRALGLSLAARDPAANVLYIARPCQFTPFALDAKCQASVWTSRRFAEDVIVSVNQAIDQLTRGAKKHALHLVGYSGGGAVAVLVAARRDDVASLRTVAGNLDHEEVNRLNDVSPMPDSLNAIDHARKLAALPQIHFSGKDDEIVPSAVAKKFLAASEPSKCVSLLLVAEADHENGWSERWPDLLKIQPKCD